MGDFLNKDEELYSMIESILGDSKAKHFSRPEIIDGVIIVHTGLYMSRLDSKGNYHPHELLHMYDEKGNKFYSNYSSKEEAAEAIIRLANEGIEAVIGPKAPWTNHLTDELMPNKDENAVGLYIVKEKEQRKTK